MASIRRALLLGFVLVAAWGSTALAQSYQHRLYLDLDNNAATGCSVTTAAGAVSGIEVRLTATVQGQPPMVTSSTRETCSGGVFGAPQAQAAGYPVGLGNGGGGSDVVELATPLTGLGSGGPANVVFVSTSATGADLVGGSVALPGNVQTAPPALIPSTGLLGLILLIGVMLWLARRHPGIGTTAALVLLLGAGIAWAANFITDGQVGDWTGVNPLATDANNDSSSGEDQIELVQVFVATENGRLFARADVLDAEPSDNAVPVATSDSFSVDEDGVLTITAPGVLDNDTDSDGDTLSVVVATGPANGVLTLNSDGSFSYTPNPNFNGSDGFTYTLSDGNGGSVNGTVTLTVNAVNDAPVAQDDAYAVAVDGTLTVPAPGLLTNDSDPDGDALRAIYVTHPQNGTYSLDIQDGSLTYTPNAGFSGTDSFTYVADDFGANGTSAPATVTITVGNVANLTPQGQPDAYSTPVGVVLVTGNVLANDDLGNQPTTIVAFDDPSSNGGTVVDNGNGSFTYTPPAGFDGTDDFSYTIEDADGETSTTTVTITVTPVNDAPDASDANASTPAGTAVSIDLFCSDNNGDALTFAIAGAPANGSLGTLVQPGVVDNASVVYTPNSGFSGADSFTFTCTDGMATSQPGTVTITVGAAGNNAPVADDATFSLDENSAATTAVGTVTATDPDAGDTLSYAISAGNGSGAFAIDANTGAISVANAAPLNFEATPSFVLTVTVTDSGALSDTATITINLNDVNDAPVLADAARGVAEDSPDGTNVGAPVVATDPDTSAPNNTLSYAITAGNTGNAFAIDNAGQITVATAAAITDPGTFTLTVTVTDGGALSDTATITVTVGGTNDAPVATGDAFSTNEDTALVVPAPGLLGNDTDPENDPLTAVLDAGPLNGALALNADGSFTYTPSANFNGSDSFSYHANDGALDSGVVTVTITINAVNDAPVAVDDGYTVDEDMVLSVTAPGPLANDTDVDLDTLFATTDSGASAQSGTYTVFSDGTVSYTPAANFSGTDTFSYTVTDGNGGTDVGTITVAVNPVNDAPTMVNLSAATVAELQPAGTTVGTLSTLDPDVGDTHTYSLACAVPGANDADFVIGAGNELQTAAPLSPPGSRAICVRSTDSGGLTRDENFTITVSDVDFAPVVTTSAGNAPYIENSGGVIVDFGITVIDPDSADLASGIVSIASGYVLGDELLFTDQNGITGVFNPGTGTLQLTGTSSVANYQTALASIQYDHIGDDPGAAPRTVQFVVSDGVTASGAAMKIIDVVPINDAPVLTAPAGPLSVNVGDTLAFTGPNSISVADADAGNGIVTAQLIINGGTLTVVPQGSANVTVGPPDTTLIVGNLTDVNATLATLTFTDPNGGTYGLTVVISDQGNTGTGGPQNDNALIQIDVVDPAAPSVTSTIPTNGATGVARDANITLNFSESVDIASAAAFSLDCPSGSPVPFTVTTPALLPASATNFVVTPTGLLPYGTTCTFTVFAAQVADSDTADPPDTMAADYVFTFTVVPNMAPVANSDAYMVDEDGTLNVPANGVLGNDTDAESEPLTAAVVVGPANASSFTLNLDGSFDYTPNANFFGTDAFTYQANDGTSNSNTATVTITVNPLNDAPVATDGNASTNEDTPVVVALSGSDVDGDALTFAIGTGPTSGSLGPITQLTPSTASVTYTPNADDSGPDSFTFTVDDGTVTSAAATMSINVAAVDDPPVAVADAATVNEDSGATAIDVILNDTDPDGGANTVQSVTQPANGVVVNNGANVSYQPNANYCNDPPGTSPDTFTYTLNGGSTTTVSVTVTCVNDPPTPVAMPAELFDTIGNTALQVASPAPADSPATIEATGNLVANFTDIDGPGPLTAALVNANGHTVTVNPDGSFSFTPSPGAASPATFTYAVSDGVDPSATRTVTVDLAGRVWYVNNAAAAGGNGTSTAPFDTLAEAETASVANDTIFVYQGDGTTTGQNAGIALKNGQRLIGQAVNLDMPTPANFNCVCAAGSVTLVTGALANRPLIGNAAGNGVSASNVIPAEVAGLNLGGSADGLDLNNTAAVSGTLILRQLIVRNAGTHGIDIDAANTSAATNLTLALANLDIRNTGGDGLRVRKTQANALIVSQFTGIDVTGASGDGAGDIAVRLVNVVFDSNPATPALEPVSSNALTVGSLGDRVGGGGVILNGVQGTLSLARLDVYTNDGLGLSATGSGSGFTLNQTNTLSVIDAFSGPAVLMNSVTMNLAFGFVSSAGSPSFGLELTQSPGTFSASTGSITSATNADVSITGSNANVSYGGVIVDDLGPLISIANTTGGTKAFTGSISDGNDGDGSGITLSSNGGATIRFSGGLQLSTGGNPAFTATGGGTVEVCATNPCGGGAPVVNTLATGAREALNVANTSIGAGGMTFRSINSNGGTQGIVLTNTGTGAFTVTGSGPASSGGSIQNATTDAIRLTNTGPVSLSSMTLDNSVESHIDANTVNGLTLTDVLTDLSGRESVLGNGVRNLVISGGTFDRGGLANTACNFNGMTFNNLLGTSSVTGATFARSNTIQFRVNNNTATNFGGAPDTLTVSGTIWRNHNQPVSGGTLCFGDHLSVNADTGGNFRLTVNASAGINVVNSTNDANGGGIGVQATAGGSGKMDVSVTGLKTSNNTAGVVVANTGTGAVTYNIFGNKSANGTGFSGTGSLALAVSHVSTGGTTTGTIDDNSVVHTAGPGTNAVQVTLEGGGTVTTRVANNTVTGNFQRAFQGQSRSGTGTLNLTLDSNSFNGTDTTGGALQVVNLETGGSGAGHGNAVCLNMLNNAVTFGSGASYLASYRLVNRGGANCSLQACSFGLQNFAGNGSNTGDISNWVTTTKSNSTGGNAVAVTATQAFVASGGCPTP